ncbi:hypothetical protein LPTSP4_02010 [Leptospira ryugenii]|uniref:PF04286 domain protein n=1 Tax=Leptospira ryugenii TaxID=1917863 RepID=A0A2P2DVP0_9LEPT|nr:DUF445 family protein [Leptospira ryugenii]GBF48701.1 hypothetical protein LPTSP4_02010 [Leptospira ryugenii]
MTPFFSSNIFFYSLLYAYIGCVTNWLAVQMMFYPLHFRGFFSVIGWQGVIPKKSQTMASHLWKIIQNSIAKDSKWELKIHEVQAEETLREPLSNLACEQIFLHLERNFPKQTSAMSTGIRMEIKQRIVMETENWINKYMLQLRTLDERALNLQNMMVSQLTGDHVQKLNQIFQTVGRTEFRFIILCGALLGGLLGFVLSLQGKEMIPIWAFVIFGSLVGYITNWLAIQMIFRPIQKVKLLGNIHWQGLFLRRRFQVADDFSQFFSEEIFSPEHLFDFIFLHSPTNEFLKECSATIQFQIQKLQRILHPNFDDMTEAPKEISWGIAVQILEEIQKRKPSLLPCFDFQKDLRLRLKEYLNALPNQQFETILRSIFKEDESSLVWTGAVLGACFGLLPIIYIC